ncbi:uncharacterized protein LOC130541752 isoform X2 [Pan paniscus]|uniref:uncharacterized protein LOC130541752 isoform X2 n=1 Tax=Pan paniscus TaxID=9597 RepID=UPI00300769C9
MSLFSNLPKHHRHTAQSFEWVSHWTQHRGASPRGSVCVRACLRVNTVQDSELRLGRVVRSPGLRRQRTKYLCIRWTQPHSAAAQASAPPPGHRHDPPLPGPPRPWHPRSAGRGYSSAADPAPRVRELWT